MDHYHMVILEAVVEDMADLEDRVMRDLNRAWFHMESWDTVTKEHFESMEHSESEEHFELKVYNLTRD